MGVRYQSEDERELAAVCNEHRAAQAAADRLKDKRDAKVAGLRAQGLPMRRLAQITGLTDSYLSRVAIGRGQPRRAVRG
jgi:hypothetical protein